MNSVKIGDANIKQQSCIVKIYQCFYDLEHIISPSGTTFTQANTYCFNAFDLHYNNVSFQTNKYLVVVSKYILCVINIYS